LLFVRILLRVSSPGGGISACDRIYKRLIDFRGHTGKKMVVSMGSVAASGGYYISVPAHAIYAEPTTITGSIGVLASVTVLAGTLEKIGVEIKVVRSSQAKAWKAAPNMMERPADYQMAELQKTIDKMHERFQSIVITERGQLIKARPKTTKTYTGADGKEFSVTETYPYNGQIFLAAEAKKLGMIDKVGYVEDAIDGAAKLAGLGNPKVVLYSPRRSILQEMGLARSSPLSLESLEQLQIPQIMMVWKVGN